MKPDFEKIASDIVVDGNPAWRLQDIKKALEDAYRAGRLDGKQEVLAEFKPPRKELGCPAQGTQCYCTGRCKRTQEEQDAHEQYERQMGSLLSRKPGWKP